MNSPHKIDFPSLAEHLLGEALELLSQWLPAGKLRGREYACGNVQGEAGDSLNINIDKGCWKDHATGESGGDLISLYAAIHGLKQSEAAKKLSNGHVYAAEDVYVTGRECHPLPRYKHGKPSHVFEYHNAEGVLIGYVCRFEPLNEKKQFSPLTCWRKADGTLVWKWKKWPITSPIYGAEKVSANPNAKVLIVEGELKANKAQLLLPQDWIAVGWAGGVEAIKCTDWGALKFRYCWFWPDADEPGRKAGITLNGILPDLHTVALPDGLPEAWDLGDAPADFDVARFLQEKSAPVVAKRHDSGNVESKLVKGTSNNTRAIINGVEFKGVAQKSIQNVMVLTETDKDINGCLIYNIFADDVFFIKPPPWEDPKTFTPHPLREDEILNYRAWVDTRGLVVGKNDGSDILLAIARRNTVNPPKEYYEKLVWDGKSRLDNWLAYYLGAEEQSAEYLKMVGSKWMIAAVKRVYEPGCKFDNVLILEGEQYIGKSRALEILATINGARYFTDEGVDFRGNNKDSLLKLQGKLIFEMPELASFRKAETDEIKAFITRSVDEYRPPYARKSAPRPRMFVMAGSVNPIAGYLTDPTGNRRYWPVRCGRSIDLESLEKDKEQLWAEAVYRCKKGEQIWLEPAEHDLAKLEQQDRMIDDIMADKIIEAARAATLEKWPVKDFFLSELVGKLNIPLAQLDGKMRLRITDCLVGSGYIEYKPRQIDGSQKRKWKLASDTTPA